MTTHRVVVTHVSRLYSAPALYIQAENYGSAVVQAQKQSILLNRFPEKWFVRGWVN